MIFDAIEFAVKAHSGQYRKVNKVPYIVHPLSVMQILMENGCSEEIAVAGVLHDTVEDTGVSLQDIRQKFGETIARLVEGASEPPKTFAWEYRKKHHLEKLKIAPPDVLLLVCVDKLDNIRSMRTDYEQHGEALWTKFSRPKEKQHWFFQSLVEIFEQRMPTDPGQSLFLEFRKQVQAVFE